MSKILMVAGIVLSANGLFMCVMSNLNIGSILTLFSGVFLLMWGLLYDKIRAITSNGAMKYVKLAIIVLILAEIGLISFISVYGQIDNVSYNEDAVIVLGAGLRGDRVTLPLKLRLDKAIEYHSKNPDAVIVVTGGKGFQETVTEASAMEEYLINKGVDKSVIIKEELATSTNENMRFSKEILDEYFGDEYKSVIITNNFHIYRGVSIAKIEGLKNISHMHAGLQWYNLAPCYLRESLAVLKMWLLG